MHPPGKTPHALVIGIGRMGAEHYRSIQTSGHFAKTIVVVDPNATVRAEYSAMGAKVFENLAHVDLSAIDLAVVAAPSNRHLEIARILAGQQMNCLLEKPCGLNSTEHQKLLNLSGQATAKFQIGFWRRLSEPFQRIKSVLHSGQIGTPRAVLACQWDAVIPNLATQPIGATGGIGVDCGIHETDTIAWLGLGRLRALSATSPTIPSPRVASGDYDQLCTQGITDQGIVASIMLSRTAGGVDEIFYKIIGDSGSVELRLGSAAEISVHLGNGKIQTIPVESDWFSHALVRQIIAASRPDRSEQAASPADAVAAAQPWFELQATPE